MSTYTQLAANLLTFSESVNASAAVLTHDAAVWEIGTANQFVRFEAAATFTYDVNNRPDSGNFAEVELWEGGAAVARINVITGNTSASSFVTTLPGPGAKPAFNALFLTTNETGDANANALETYSSFVTLTGGGGSNRFLVDKSNITINGGADDDTLYVNASSNTNTWHVAGGINKLWFNNISSFTALDTTGDSLTGFSIFEYGTGSGFQLPQFLRLSSNFVPTNATFIGNNPDPNSPFFQKNWLTIDLSAAVTSYDASGWTLVNLDDSNDVVFLNGQNAASGVTITGPNSASTVNYTGYSGGGNTFIDGDGNGSFNFGGGTGNSGDGGAGAFDNIFINGNVNDYTVTAAGANQYDIVGSGFSAHLANVERLIDLFGDYNLADLVGPAPPPPPPVNHPPVVKGFSSDGTKQFDSAFFETAFYGTRSLASDFSDPDGDKLTFTATLGTGAALPAWLTCSPGGVLSGKPPVQDWGTNFTVILTADDGHGGFADLFVTVVIDAAPRFFGVGKWKVREDANVVKNLSKFVSDKEVDQGGTQDIAETALPPPVFFRSAPDLLDRRRPGQGRLQAQRQERHPEVQEGCGF